MILLILGLAIVSMFLVGCVDQAAENTEDAEQPDSVEVMDGDGDLVGEAFRFAPYKYRLAKKAVPKLPEMPSYNCLIGFDYVAGPVADDYFYVEDGDAISCVNADYVCEGGQEPGSTNYACGAGYAFEDGGLYEGKDVYGYCCKKA